MGLYESIEEDEAKLLALEKEEEQKDNEPEKQEDPVVVEDAASVEEEQQDAQEEPVEEAPQEEEAPQDNAAQARKRVQEKERKEYERLREENEALQRRLDALTRPQEQAPAPQADIEPDKATHPLDWAEWRIRQAESKISVYEPILQEQAVQKQVADAVAGFEAFERDFVEKESPSDYQEVSNHLFKIVAANVSMQNPGLGENELVYATRIELLKMANQHYQAGRHPVQALYKQGKALMQSFAPQEAVAAPSKPVAQNLRVIASNKKTPSTPLVGGGRTASAPLTADGISRLTNAQLAALSEEDLERVVNGR